MFVAIIIIIIINYLQKPTSELMAAIQLGIGQSITSLVGKPKRDLLLQDFSIVETVQFPRSAAIFMLPSPLKCCHNEL